MLDEIVERGELRVGMTLQFEPEMYLDESGEPAGYDVELLNLLATDLGVELTIENQEFDALIPGLLAGTWDMISVGLVPRPPRLLQMYFSDSYVPYDQVLVAAADSDREPTISAYNVADTTITALQGSTAAEQVTTQFPEATLAEFPQQDGAFLEVRVGSRRRDRRRELPGRAVHPGQSRHAADRAARTARCRSSTAPMPCRSATTCS